MAGKNINLFLMDGTIEGRVKCGLANWTGLAYKIPREYFAKCDNIKETQNNGIYFLIGVDENDQEAVYVGQARQRSNGKGLLGRIVEPHNSIMYWKEAILLTTRDDYFGPTELCYLEHKFYRIAKEAKRFIVTNGNTPSIGNPTEEKQCELNEFIDFSKLVISAMGYKFLVPLVPDCIKHKISAGTVDDNCQVTSESTFAHIFSMSYNGATATAAWTDDGIVVLKGSTINKDITATCPASVKNKRNQYADKIVDDKLQEDVLFKSPSGAASFIAGAHVNGKNYWQSEDGKTIGELMDKFISNDASTRT